MKTVLILSNHHLYTYNLRKEVIQKLIDLNYKVIIALPYGEKVEKLREMGCEFINVNLDRRGTNPFGDLKLLIRYASILKRIKPELVLTYTLKPNLYGGLACRINKIKVLHTVTGLGTIFVRNVWYKNIIVYLNKISFKNSYMVAFMNQDNKELYKELEIINIKQDTIIVAGSGVNLMDFPFEKYPETEDNKFTFIARILKDKGIEEFLEAAVSIKSKYLNVKFEIVGFVDEEKYRKILEKLQKRGVISYLGQRDDISNIMADSSCIVLPSYGEGRGTVLQEAASVGRPLITCDTYGCKENVEEGVNGFLCKVADSDSLEKAMIKFIDLSYDEKSLMGKKSRKMAEENFDREIIIQKYINVINSI